MGHVVKLNYREQVRRVIKAAMPLDAVELTFYTGDTIRISMGKQREEIFFDYGAIKSFRCCPKSEAELYRVISMEHRYQKGWRPKTKKRPDTLAR